MIIWWSSDDHLIIIWWSFKKLLRMDWLSLIYYLLLINHVIMWQSCDKHPMIIIDQLTICFWSTNQQINKKVTKMFYCNYVHIMIIWWSSEYHVMIIWWSSNYHLWLIIIRIVSVVDHYVSMLWSCDNRSMIIIINKQTNKQTIFDH